MMQDPEVAQLFQEADNYAEVAMKKLTLEPTVLKPQGWIDDTKRLGRVAKEYLEMSADDRLELFRVSYIVYYIFPNLNDERRDSLEKMADLVRAMRNPASASDSEETDSDRRGIYEALRARVGDKDLTELQIRVLDSEFFSPDMD
jgi:hypothetical protein